MEHLLLYVLFATIAFALSYFVKIVTGTNVFPFAMALSADYNGPRRERFTFYRPLAAGVKIFGGGIVVLDSAGNGNPASTATGLICDGRARMQVDNTGGIAGALSVEVEKGCFRFANSASADLIDATCIGSICYLVDDFTVAKTSATGTRSIAGPVMDVDADGVWVNMGMWVYMGNGDLVSTNNLSDVTNKATARANLGTNLMALTLDVALLNGTAVYRVASPVAGTITKIQTDLKAALGTGNATLTGAIGAVAITAGVVTLVQSGSVAGQVNVCSPSGNNVVSVGSDINFTVGGSNSVATGCTVTILIAY